NGAQATNTSRHNDFAIHARILASVGARLRATKRQFAAVGPCAHTSCIAPAVHEILRIGKNCDNARAETYHKIQSLRGDRRLHRRSNPESSCPSGRAEKLDSGFHRR
ncbi:MAG: hypothetical protein ACREPL_11375, partial [Rhodanobacteraceae bacterium]